MKLFHATGADSLRSIAKDGLHADSYWSCSKELTRYYMETIEDEGRESKVLCIDLADLQSACKIEGHVLLPDLPGIEEPITGVLGKTEKQIWDEWKASGKGRKGSGADAKAWQDSLSIVSSLKCPVRVTPCRLSVLDMEGGDEMRLGDYVQAVIPKLKKFKVAP